MFPRQAHALNEEASLFFDEFMFTVFVDKRFQRKLNFRIQRQDVLLTFLLGEITQNRLVNLLKASYFFFEGKRSTSKKML